MILLVKGEPLGGKGLTNLYKIRCKCSQLFVIYKAFFYLFIFSVHVVFVRKLKSENDLVRAVGKNPEHEHGHHITELNHRRQVL